uniref:ARIF-1 n=1 Tax=Chrysodeixis includens nucleopolyhedrovirus TaxID=1207438 RepID=A0A1C8ZXN5_9ABAC|nr:ARIF-1 [Chrysodeixis includens nucleopolyhedrovirus]
MQAYLQYYTKVMLFACGFTVFVLGIVGVADERFGLIIDYENGSQVVNLVVFYWFYGLIVLLSTLVYNQIAVPLIAATTILTTIALFSMDWFVTYGHVAGLDVNERDYDLNKKCWDGIVKMDNNAIQSANCFTNNNILRSIARNAETNTMSGSRLSKNQTFLYNFISYVRSDGTFIIFVCSVQTKSIDSKPTATSSCSTDESTVAQDTMYEEKIAIKQVDSIEKREISATRRKVLRNSRNVYKFKENDYDSFDGDDDSDKDEVKHYNIVDKNESPYYAVPNNNTPKWNHAAYTYMAVPTTDRQSTTAAATAPPLSFLMSSK